MFGGTSYVMESVSTSASGPATMDHLDHSVSFSNVTSTNNTGGGAYNTNNGVGGEVCSGSIGGGTSTYVNVNAHPGFTAPPSATLPGFFHGSGLNLSLNHGLDLTCPNYQGLNLSVNNSGSNNVPQQQQQALMRSKPNLSHQQGLNLTQGNSTMVHQGQDMGERGQGQLGHEVGLNLSLQNGINLSNRGDSAAPTSQSGINKNQELQQHSNVVLRKGNYLYSAQACLGYVNLSTLNSSGNGGGQVNQQAQPHHNNQHQQQQQLQPRQRRHQPSGRLSPLNLEHRSSPLNLTANDQNGSMQLTHQDAQTSYYDGQQTNNYDMGNNVIQNSYQQHQQGGKLSSYSSCAYQHSQEQQQQQQQQRPEQQQQNYNNTFFESQSSNDLGQYVQQDRQQNDQFDEQQFNSIMAINCSGVTANDNVQASEEWNMNNLDQGDQQNFCANETQIMTHPGQDCVNTDNAMMTNDANNEPVMDQQELTADMTGILSGRTNNSSKGTVVEPEVTCSQCGMVLSSGVDLKKHMDLAHMGRSSKEEQHACKVCGREFSTKSACQSHVSEEHQEQKETHECRWCDAKLSSKASLGRHVRRVHDREQPHECQECGKRFAERGDLTKHVARHRAAAAVPDCAVCKKSFQSQRLLDRHKCPGPEGKFPCELCEVKLKSKAAWGVHMWKHTKDAKYIISPSQEDKLIVGNDKSSKTKEG